MLRDNFYLTYSHKYSLRELEEMLPWEREIYLGLLEQQLKKEEEENEKLKNKAKQ